MPKIIGLQIEQEPHRRGTYWAVGIHIRYPHHRFTVNKEKRFSSEAETREWMRQSIMDGARWVRTDLLPTKEYLDLPDVRAWKTGSALTLVVDGKTVADKVTTPRELKRAILEHPLASKLTTLPCPKCLKKPTVNFAENSLTHVFKDCPMVISILLPTVPIALKIAAWNLHFSKRKNSLDLNPVTLPHLEELGILREPTKGEMINRIRRIEVL